MNDEQLEREIQTIRGIIQVRLRRYNFEMRELDRDLRELRALQRKRRRAEIPLADREQTAQESNP